MCTVASMNLYCPKHTQHKAKHDFKNMYNVHVVKFLLVTLQLHVNYNNQQIHVYTEQNLEASSIPTHLCINFLQSLLFINHRTVNSSFAFELKEVKQEK